MSEFLNIFLIVALVVCSIFATLVFLKEKD